MEFVMCEAPGRDFCLVSPRGYLALAKREVNGIRCVRHGALLGGTIEAPDRKMARDSILRQEQIDRR